MKGRMFFDPKFIIGERSESLNLTLAKTIFSELEEFSGMPIEKISKEYWQNKEGIDKVVQMEIDKSESYERVIDYYKTTTQYLYELGYWEAQKDKQREFKKLYLACKKFAIRHVLDYGGGVGGLTIYLNSRGIKCDYLDIPSKTFDFAKFRFMNRGLKIKMLNGLDEIPKGNHDAIICYDVLEHVFDLNKTIDTISNCLPESGLFIHRSTFGTGGIHLRKYALYQDFAKFNRFLKSFGFEFVGRLKAGHLSTLIQEIGLKYVLFDIRISRKMKYGGNFLLHKKVSMNEE